MDKQEIKGEWYSLKAGEEERKAEYLHGLEPEKWKEMVRNVIMSLLTLERPSDWDAKWKDVGMRLKESNKHTAYPIPEEDIEMMFVTMSDEQRPPVEGVGKPLTFKDLLETEYPAARFILDPYFEQGAVNMVSAPPNTWKSWLLFSLAAAVAEGEPLWGQFATEKHKVMIVNEEDSPRAVQDRFKLLDIGNKDLEIYFHIAKGLKIDKTFTERIIAEMRDVGADVLMLDSLRSMHEAEENDSTAMQVVLDHLKTIAREGITVIFTHHHRKRHPLEKQQGADASRGSSAINAAVSGHISLDEEKREDGTFLVVHHLKSKVGAKIEPVEVRITVGDLTGTVGFEYQGSFKSSNKKIETATKTIVETLKSGGWMSVNDFLALEVAGLSIIRASLRDLKKAGMVKTITRAEAYAKELPIEGEGKPNETFYSWCEGKDNELDSFAKDVS